MPSFSWEWPNIFGNPSPPGSFPSPKFSYPAEHCYIIDLDSGASNLEFQLMPQTVSETKSANYDTIPIIGRSLPYLGYSHSSARQLNLSLEFAALTNSDGAFSPDWVKSRVRWLESKVYPQYKGELAYPPPRLLVSIGDALSLVCVMTNVSTTWLGPWDITSAKAKPFRAQVDCSFEEWGENGDEYGHPHGHDEALQGLNQADGGVLANANTAGTDLLLAASGNSPSGDLGYPNSEDFSTLDDLYGGGS